MYLKELQISNYKNYETASLAFIDKVNAIVGENGSGKTNLLDAVHYLALCKSHLTSQDKNVVRFGADFFALHGVYCGFDDQRTRTISCTYKVEGHKILKINQKAYNRLSDHIGQYPLIMVSPTDSNLIHEGSDIRRKFVDLIISQFDKEYLHSLIAYQKILNQRNIILKQFRETGNFDSTLLQIYNQQLIPNGQYIYQKREAFSIEIIPIFQKYYEYLSESKEKVHITYQTSLNTIPFEQSLQQSEPNDFLLGHTTVGIHKDDFLFLMDEHAVKLFSSQGQQKSFTLALKLALFDFIFSRTHIKPILLLDDIFDKLDEKRTAQLLALVGQEHFGQVFLSDTDESRITRILNTHHIQHQIIHIPIKSDEEE